ncbi:MAG: glycoside hydrolase family 16 protein, partial [Myxococcota bacterium]
MIAVAVFFAGCGADLGETEIGVPLNFIEVFSQEFDEAEGTPIDTSVWNFDIGNGPNNSGWGNNEQQYYTDSTDNIAHDGNGNLRIRALEVEFQEQFNFSRYTSARVTTLGKFDQRFGRFEASMKMPTGQGLWPAFWMLGADFPDVGWPLTGEIDVIEYSGNEPTSVSGALHGPGFNGGAAILSKYNREVAPEEGDTELVRWDQGFHVYAVEWEPTRITWSVDNEVYFSITSSEVQAISAANCETGVVSASECSTFSLRERWPFDDPFFL